MEDRFADVFLTGELLCLGLRLPSSHHVTGQREIAQRVFREQSSYAIAPSGFSLGDMIKMTFFNSCWMVSHPMFLGWTCRCRFACVPRYEVEAKCCASSSSRVRCVEPM